MTPNQPLDINSPPVPGFFKTRMVKGGIFVPIRVARLCTCSVGDFKQHEWSEACDRYPQELTAFVNGRRAYLEEVWARLIFLQEIDQAEYNFMLKDAIWCEENAPEDPKANPTRAINRNKIKSIF